MKKEAKKYFAAIAIILAVVVIFSVIVLIRKFVMLAPGFSANYESPTPANGASQTGNNFTVNVSHNEPGIAGADFNLYNSSMQLIGRVDSDWCNGADMNRDGVLDGTDYFYIDWTSGEINAGKSLSETCEELANSGFDYDTCLRSDINNDGTVDNKDYLIINPLFQILRGDCNFWNDLSPVNFGNLSEGVYYYDVNLTDSDGDRVGTELRSLTIGSIGTTCIPNCSCAASTCSGSTCSDRCSGSCTGTKSCGGDNGGDNGGGGGNGGGGTPARRNVTNASNVNNTLVVDRLENESVWGKEKPAGEDEEEPAKINAVTLTVSVVVLIAVIAGIGYYYFFMGGNKNPKLKNFKDKDEKKVLRKKEDEKRIIRKK